MAEWLGSALQKLLRRFESGSDLKKNPAFAGFFSLNTLQARLSGYLN